MKKKTIKSIIDLLKMTQTIKRDTHTVANEKYHTPVIIKLISRRKHQVPKCL